jgi:hypothetical protein
MSGEVDRPAGSATEAIFTAAVMLSPTDRAAYLAGA